MNTLFIGKNFVELPTVPSTNEFLAGIAHTGMPEGTVVFARHQTAGKGQQGNTWLGDPNLNLACSVLLHPRFLSPSSVFVLNKAVALALAGALQALLPDHSILIKWPNDILLDRRKVAGILIENQLDSRQVQASIIGFGINVNQVEFGEGYGHPTSLRVATGREFDVHVVLEQVLTQLERRYLALRNGQFAALEHDYLHLLYAYQEETDLRIDGAPCRAIPVGVDAHGRLAVQVDGALRYFGIKEIQFVL